MLFLSRQIFLIVGFMLIFTDAMRADQEALVNSSIYVSDGVWAGVKDYLIPNEHPIKGTLDQIFSRSRALSDKESMVAAGFAPAVTQKHTGIIVTRHPELQGYVIKAYLDKEPYHDGKPEHHFWIKRVKGAQLVRASIAAHHYESIFKVPKKWIYLLPDEPSPPHRYLRKMFILVEEDMDLLDDKTNEQVWGSRWVTEDLLDALFTLTTEVGLADCTKPQNCPFSIDGKVAFIDTQTFNTDYVKYQRLTPFLSSPMRDYWKKITKGKKNTKSATSR